MSENSKPSLIIWLTVLFLVFGIPIALLVAANRPPPAPKVHRIKLPNPNGWDDLVKASKFEIRPFGPYSSATHMPDKWTAAELASWMHKSAPVLAMVRKGLSEPCVRPPEDSPAMFGAEANMRELGRTIRGEALYYKVIHKPARAVDSLLDCVEMGVVTQRGGGMIPGLVGSAIESMAIYDIEPLLPKLSPTDLAHLADRMVRINAKRVPYADILVGYGRESAAMESYEFGTGNRLAAACDWDGDWIDRSKGDPSTLTRVSHSVRFGFLNKSKMLADNQAYFTALAKEQSKPYTGKSNVPIPDNPLIRLYGPTFLARVIFVRNEAVFTILQTEIALRRYRVANRRYPSHLFELVPTYLKSAPIDPFGLGKALKYRSTNNGKSFLLYSIGPDMRDNRGKPIAGRFVTQSSIGDIVAGKLVVRP